MPRPRVLSVGQCSLDHNSLSAYLGKEFDAEVAGARSFAEALAAPEADSFDLVLVNRISDADGTRGAELVRTVRADPSLAQIPVMLVSNYADAQAEAVALGALPGFGKAELRSSKAHDAVSAALAPKA